MASTAPPTRAARRIPKLLRPLSAPHNALGKLVRPVSTRSCVGSKITGKQPSRLQLLEPGPMQRPSPKGSQVPRSMQASKAGNSYAQSGRLTRKVLRPLLPRGSHRVLLGLEGSKLLSPCGGPLLLLLCAILLCPGGSSWRRLLGLQASQQSTATCL